MNYVALAIPFFLLFVVIELIVNYVRKKDYFTLNDSINSLHLGVLSQLVGLAKKALQFSMYAFLFPFISLWSLGTEGWWVWLGAFVLYDFCYYWYHRCSHEINGLWAAHVVHHQSEEYNLTTALRQTSGGLINFIFYLPLAILGVEPIVFIAVSSLNLVYQFWVHTRHINLMPRWYEFMFVTPSNHRVHHGQNPVYLDKNHGGVFILWDRLFGTFQKELDEEPVIYGVTKPLASWNPFWANIEVYWGLFQDSWRTKHWADKARVWYKKTGWRPDDVQAQYPSPVFDPYKQIKFDTKNSVTQKMYLIFQHLATLGLALVVLYQSPNTPLYFNAVSLVVIGFGLFTTGLYQSQTQYSTLAEWLKCIVWAIFILLAPYEFIIPIELALIYVMVSTVWLWLNLRSHNSINAKNNNKINDKTIISGQ